MNISTLFRRGGAEGPGIGRKLISWGLTVLMILGINTFPVMSYATDTTSLSVDEGQTLEIPFSGCDCATPDSSKWVVTITNSTGRLTTTALQKLDSSTLKGEFKAEKDGTATVHFSCSECSYQHDYEVTIVNTITNELGLSLNQTSMQLTAGGSETVTASWTDTSQNPNITWTTSNPSAATVAGSGSNNKKGTISAVGAGTATITATDSVSGETATCSVEVSAAPSYDDKVTVTGPTSATYKKGANASALSVSAVANISGVNTTSNLTYQWYKGTSSSNVNSAIGGAVGNIYTPSTSSTGTTYYKCVVTYTSGSKTVSGTSKVVSVTVNNSETNPDDDYTVKLDADKTSLGPDEETTLTVKVYDYRDKLVSDSYKVTWTSNYPKIISLDEKTTKLKNGKSTNTAKCDDDNDENKNVTITAEVTIDGNTYSDTQKIKAVDEADEKYGLSLSADNSTLSKGGYTTLTATVTRNGSTYKSERFTVDWTIKSGRGYASLDSTTSRTSDGKATNVLNVPTNLTGSGSQTVTVEAEVKIDGKYYNKTKSITVNLGNANNNANNYVPVPVNTNTNTNTNSNTNKGKVNIVLQIDNPTIVSNGNPITNDVAPIIANNRTMVPIRAVNDMLGGTTYWDNDTRTVTLVVNGKVLNMTIGTTLPGFDVAPFILNDRTYVPVRYISEAIGYNVQWIDSSRQVVITG